MNNATEMLNPARNLVRSMPESMKESPQHASRLNNLAVICQSLSRFGEADDLYRRSIAIWERTLGHDHPRVAQSSSNRASLYRLIHEFHEAELVYQLALNTWHSQGWPTETEMGQTELSDESPLWAEQVEVGGALKRFRTQVQELRHRVESGSEEAREQLVEMMEKLGPWYHNLNFSGIDTNPDDPDYPARRWRALEPFVPKDLRGKTVLDIGCNVGYLSLEMKKRGAERVISIDFMAHLVGQVRFASYWFDLPLEPRLLDVYDVESLGVSFDYVVFVGVLYHLKHPLYALEKVANVCKDTLIFQSLTRGPAGDFEPEADYEYSDETFFEDANFPRMYFLEKSFNSDESNWWIATQSCLKAMLRVSGFRNITDTSEVDHFVCRKD